MKSHEENRKYILRLWVPAIAIGGLFIAAMLSSLVSGTAAEILPIVIAVVVTAGFILFLRWQQGFRLRGMLRSADPERVLRSMTAQLERVPHGRLFGAANRASVLALYGRFADAESALNSVSWDDVPPIVEAQRAAALAVIAYARGAIEEGLDHAVAGTLNGSLDVAVPGARTSELGFRTYRNLGLALSGRATNRTVEELNTAFARLPFLGKILAAWGLAAIARERGRIDELRSMQAFLRDRVPYCKPVLESVDATSD